MRAAGRVASSRSAGGLIRHLAPRRVVMAAVLLCAAAVLIAPPATMPGGMPVAAALILVTIGMLATGILAEQLAILTFFLLAVVLAVAPPAVVFSGFSSGAFWLVFGGLVIGAAVDRTGLGARVASAVVRRVSGGYAAVIGAIVLVNVVMIFLMPSTMSRVIMLLPVVMALADGLGYRAGSRPRSGMVMALVLSAYLCSTSVLPANVPNNVLLGAAETFQGVEIRYFDYLLLHFPVLGLLKALVVWGCIVWIFRPPPGKPEAANDPAVAPKTRAPAGVFSAEEGRLAVLLTLALLLWATDALHGVAPAWISLGAALLCLLPGLGVVSPEGFRDKVQIGPLIYVAGIIGIGAVVSETGLGAYVSRAMLDAIALSADAPLAAFAALSGLSMALGVVSTMPGVPAILVPIAGDMQAASGLSLEAVLMTQVLGFSTVWFPYQVPPIIVGMQLGGVAMSDGLKATVATAVISVVLINPLDALWWRVLGYLPDGAIW